MPITPDPAVPYPLLIEFTPGSRVEREPDFSSPVPLLYNGQPGTFVVFADGTRVAVPTDQIVHTDNGEGSGADGARVAFGGMRAAGEEGGQLVFHRVRDLLPPEQLSPQRGRRMTLEPHMVVSVHVDGAVVWRRA